MMVAAAGLHHRHRALPGRPRPLLGDDEPVDGRPGPRHAPARAEDARAEPGPKRASKHAAADDEPQAATASAAARSRRRSRAPAAAEAGEARRRAARGGERASSRVEATGETVGEAKWKRAARARAPRAGARQGRGSVPGALGGRARPARRRLRAGARARERRPRRRPAGGRSRRRADDETTLARHVRELVTRVTAALGVRCRIEVPRTRRRVDGDLHRRRPRPPDRQARPDDRRDPVPRERDRSPATASERKQVVVDAAGYRDRRRQHARGARRARAAEQALRDGRRRSSSSR